MLLQTLQSLVMCQDANLSTISFRVWQRLLVCIRVYKKKQASIVPPTLKMKPGTVISHEKLVDMLHLSSEVYNSLNYSATDLSDLSD